MVEQPWLNQNQPSPEADGAAALGTSLLADWITSGLIDAKDGQISLLISSSGSCYLGMLPWSFF